MRNTGTGPKWRIYERLVAAMHSETASSDLTVVPNAKLSGCISGTTRQVDVLIDSRLEENVKRRTIVDAKLRRRKIDVKDVEAFEGMMKDCRAHRGIIVCANGYTGAAKRRAQEAITISLVQASEIDELDLSQWESCMGQCAEARNAGKPPGWVLFDQVYSVGSLELPSSLVAVGKCDVCHDFHVSCWDCGQHLVLLGDEGEAKCDCDRFWLSAVDSEGNDEYGNPLKSVLLIVVALPSGQPNVLDRRPLN